MHLLVTGATGSLGAAVVRLAAARGWQVTALGRAELDVTDAAAVAAAVGGASPDAVVHAAAMTDVDGCERDPARAAAVNGDGPANVAAACARAGARLVAVSTDLVFGAGPTPQHDGAARGYHAEDPVAPLQVYGRSKRDGEVRALAAHGDVVVARTAVLAGPESTGFVGKVAARAAAGQPLRVVTDQVGSPTFVDDLAPALLELVEADVTGVVHRVGEGSASRHELAVATVEALGLDATVEPMTSADLPPGGAPRPGWSVLDQSRAREAGLCTMPHWRDGLAGLVPALRAASGPDGGA